MAGVNETPDERVLYLVDELVEEAAFGVTACTLRMSRCIILADADDTVSFLVAEETD